MTLNSNRGSTDDITKENNSTDSQSSLIYYQKIEKAKKIQRRLDTIDKTYINQFSNRNSPHMNLLPLLRLKNNALNSKLILSPNSYTQIQKSDSIIKTIKKIDESLYNRLLKSSIKYNSQLFNSNSITKADINTSIKQPEQNKALRNDRSTLSPITYPRSSSLPKIILPQMIKKKAEGKEYNYYIYPGNNSPLIEKCMKTRKRWKMIGKDLIRYADFIWAPISKDIEFGLAGNSIQYVNHLEYHSELSNKMKLFNNLMKYCEKNIIDLFSFFPLTISIHFTHKNYIDTLNSFMTFYANISQYIKRDDEPCANDVKYKDMFLLNSKQTLGSKQTIQIPSTHYNESNLWLIKPINLNRGRCIIIDNDVSNIINEINKIRDLKQSKDYDLDKITKSQYLILQKYIEAPLLYRKRKFDIRMWVLVNDLCDVYVFKEGHLKASSELYDITCNSLFIHLTNYSVQKLHCDFSSEEIGNEISFDEFQKELDSQGSKVNFYKDIYPKICNIIKLTILAVKNRVNYLNRRKCFEIFGYDFLIDAKYNPFLIEINTNPGLEESSPLISKLIPRMIDDAIKLVIDPYTCHEVADSQFSIEKYSNRDNLWERLNLHNKL